MREEDETEKPRRVQEGLQEGALKQDVTLKQPTRLILKKASVCDHSIKKKKDREQQTRRRTRDNGTTFTSYTRGGRGRGGRRNDHGSRSQLQAQTKEDVYSYAGHLGSPHICLSESDVPYSDELRVAMTLIQQMETNARKEVTYLLLQPQEGMRVCGCCRVA